MPVTIRRNSGSYPEVKTVLAYDKSRGIVGVRLRYSDGMEELDTLSLSELEAIDGNNRYVPHEPLIRARAGQMIGAR